MPNYPTRSGIAKGTPLYAITPGEQYNGLTVIGEANRADHRERQATMRCSCGVVFTASFSNIRRGNTKSCGCLKLATARQVNAAKNIPLVGETSGLLTCTEELGLKQGKRHIRCSCHCGNTKDLPAQQFIRGVTSSCGCLATALSRQRLSKARKGTGTDQTGNSFGRYKVLNEETGHRKRHWRVECTGCKEVKVIRDDAMRKLKLPYCTCTPFVSPFAKQPNA